MLNSKEKMFFAMRDIAHRSRISAVFYLVIFSIVAGFTPIYTHYPEFTIAIAVLLLLGTLMRCFSAWSFSAIYPNHPRLWKVLSHLGLLLQAGSWGMLSIMSIEYYGWQWTTMVICLSAAAFSAGAVVTLSAYFPVIALYLVFMFAPTIMVTIINGTDESLVASFLFMTYFMFLILAAKRLNREYWEALSNNILLKQRAQQLESKNRELESFTYSVSHDLRAPLRSIDGFSNMILEDAGHKLDADEKDYLERVRFAAQRMAALIDDLLQLSRVSRARYQPQDVDLSSLIESNFEKLKQQEPNRQVVLEIEPHVKATGDQSLLDIAMGNLVNNAWKYSSKKPDARIRFATQEQDGKVVYYIKDNGQGFDTKYKDKLFGPFQRLHTDDEFPGTGIGLATVHRIIDRHGGKIWANAKPGRGATFYFTIHDELH